MDEPTRACEPPFPTVSRIGLWLAPALAAAMLAAGPPPGIPDPAWKAAAIATWMALWWMTEALPLAATALLPLAAFPLSGIASLETSARAYAHPLIILFLGGFLLAKAMERWQLHRRLAAMASRAGGRQPRAVILSMMATTAFLSMWVSNTATAMVMVPIGQSLVASLRDEPTARRPFDVDDFGAALMLGIAFSATIGGMGTLIGTPPNALLAGLMQQTYGITIGFAQWMLIGVPIVIVLVPVTWLLLTRLMIRVPHLDTSVAAPSLIAETDRLEPMSRAERMVAMVLMLTALAWLLRPLLATAYPRLPLSDAGIAITAAIALFAIPVRWSEGSFLLTWEDARSIRWDVLILFGGGLALADAIHATGLAAWLGSAIAGLGELPRPALILLLFVVIVYLGEVASNTAMAAVFLPVAGAAAAAMSLAPIELMLPVALAASLGFMLPVATPPNAIAYGSGAVTARQMLRVGAVLDVIAILIVAAIATGLAPLVLPGSP